MKTYDLACSNFAGISIELSRISLRCVQIAVLERGWGEYLHTFAVSMSILKEKKQRKQKQKQKQKGACVVSGVAISF